MMCLLLLESAEFLVLRVEQVPVCVVRNTLVLDDLRNTCEVATELLKHFPYEQRTITRLTIWHEQQIAQTSYSFPLTQS
jgi:hypothetical protein